MKKVGVLALQGDFAAHAEALSRVGAAPVFVRDGEQFGDLDGLVIPGGESTTMLKLLRLENLMPALLEFGRRKPIFGTCAGAILMAKHVTAPEQESLRLMDIEVQRNAYGRQVDSRIARLQPEKDFVERTAPGELEAVFIRAPMIRQVSGDAKVLMRYQDAPVLVEQGNHLAATFHPELTTDSRIHKLFVEKL